MTIEQFSKSGGGRGSAMRSSPGTYVLIIHVAMAQTIRAGALGELAVEPGWYTYVGSAFGPGGVAGRCRHHRHLSARPHWHIDYLRVIGTLVEIWYSHDGARREHLWAEALGRGRGARQPFSGFGASDCSCGSHLFMQPRFPSFEGFRRRLRLSQPGHAPLHRELISRREI